MKCLRRGGNVVKAISWWALLALLLVATHNLAATSSRGGTAALLVHAEDTNAAAASGAEASAIEETNKETFTFQAEVSRLLDIIINSLYSNKDIFLRELISNASDALDKIRLLSLTKADILGATTELEVRISFDREKNVLTIKDTGIGMTRNDLLNNLGTIAKSGTSAFIDSVAKGGDMNLIGQFGVGFYSAFLAADKVQVISKHNDDPTQNVWESAADGNFVIYEDKENESLGRGTQLNLFLKEEATEYLDQNILEKLVAQYSQFINYPIYLLCEEKKDIEVEADDEDEEVIDLEEDDEEEEGEGEDEEEGEGEDEEEEEDEGPRMVTKTITELVWKKKNEAQAIWLRNPSEVSDSEYEEFFKIIGSGQFRGEPEAFANTHFKAEGDVEFRSILYIPKEKPIGMADNPTKDFGSRIKLFVRRVFISDNFADLLPSYLHFIVGVVDSDTLPLNVNRETLQHHASLKTIKKKLIRKALDMMKRIADDDRKAEEEAEAAEEGEEKEMLTAIAKMKEYPKFWENYGGHIKMGVMEDQPNRIRLSKLLRMKSSHEDYQNDNDQYTDLESYVSRMKEGQTKLYYLIGASLDEVKTSAFAERLISQGYEVIYFTEPLDEYLMQYLVEFNDFKFQNAAKEDLTLDDSEDSKKRQKQLRNHFRPFTKWWKSLLKEDLDSVKITNRLTKTPCVVVSSKYGYTANMERIIKAQTMADKEAANMYLGKKVLEINPFHPSIKVSV